MMELKVWKKNIGRGGKDECSRMFGGDIIVKPV